MVKRVKVRKRKKTKAVKHLEPLKIHTKNKIMCIILGENKAADMIWVSYSKSMFSYKENTYFLVPEGVYLNASEKDKVIVSVYLEGISTPLTHKHIKRKMVKRIIVKEGNKTENVNVSIIDGLKYDSKIIDVLLNRGLAEIFTRIREDKIIYLMFMLIIISMILTIVSIGVSYYYGQ